MGLGTVVLASRCFTLHVVMETKSKRPNNMSDTTLKRMAAQTTNSFFSEPHSDSRAALSAGESLRS